MQIDKDTYFCAFHNELGRFQKQVTTAEELANVVYELEKVYPCACGLPKEMEITKINTEEEMLAKIKEASIKASEMQQELVDKLTNYEWGFWDTPPEPKEE